MRESYSYTQTSPFGSYVAKRMVENIYPASPVEIINRAFSKSFASTSDTNSIYFCISRNLFLNEQEAQAMIDFAYAGNTVFIAASQIDSILLDKLMCEEIKADLILDYVNLPLHSTSVSLSPDIIQTDSFSYFFKPFANSFSSIRAGYTRVIGYNQAKSPNCYILYWGKGKMILHCDPRAFSNYFLLKDNNYRYLQSLLKITDNPEKIYWDDYYRMQNVHRNRNADFSTLSELQKYPPLAAGFWLMLALLTLYVLFNSKRRQRIIPVIKPNENSTIVFTETIARLYLQHHDNKNIADKMITYFNEHIRKSYFLNVNATSNDFISALSRKSGVSFEQTRDLFNAIHEISSREEINDQELVNLNEQIQQFYKIRK